MNGFFPYLQSFEVHMDMIAIGASGMRAQQQVIEILSANVANVNTPSYKRAEPRLRASGFSSLVAGASDAAPALLPLGVTFESSSRQMTTGQLRKTGRELDLTIRGDGFFVLTTPDGEQLFTRNGDFQVDQDGYLVGANGLRLDSNIQVPPDVSELVISANGEVRATLPDERITLGTIAVAQFANQDQLTLMSGGVYSANEHSGPPVMVEPGMENSGVLAQGFLESSNVQIVEEFVSLVVAQRAYEASAKMVQAADEMATIANGLIRG